MYFPIKVYKVNNNNIDDFDTEKVALLIVVKQSEYVEDEAKSFIEKLKIACENKIKGLAIQEHNTAEILTLKRRILLQKWCERYNITIVLLFGVQGNNVGLNFMLNPFEYIKINNVWYIFFPDIKTVRSDTINRTFEKKLWNIVSEKIDDIYKSKH